MVSSTSLHLSPALTGFALLALVTLARSHESHESPSQAMDMSMDMEASSPSVAATAASAERASYFRYSEYSSLMFAHIFLMIVGWVFVLPIAVMLSIARSRFSLVTQFIFLAFNTAGVVIATIYNAKTPDLYPSNAHHKFSWWLTWIVTAQLIMAVISRYTGRKNSTPVSPVEERASFIPISTEALAEHQQIHDPQSGNYRISNDSGQGTEPNTESLRSHSISTEGGDEQHFDLRREYEEDDGGSEKRGILRGSRMDKFLSKKLPGLLSSRALKVFHFVYDCIDRVVLILAFVALTTGFVTYGGIFTGDEIFSGLAHFIKGGVFFWYGILTLGRWGGCFGEIGWAWNIKPPKAQKAYSAEFVESFLIFFYGSTNVFLEHLNAWGKAWTAQDLEHVSITIMFFGGGLCGMLIESTTIRSLLSTTVHAKPRFQLSDEEATLQQPKSYNVSMNPLPALVVLLLGLMMSSHTQHSMISSMIHKQWGTLLTGAAFARALTYVVFYLAPPTSIFPGRPPTELITAFCLMAGGMIFMVSAKDTVMAIENNNLDAMFVFTVSMGLITFLMAWIVAVIALKGWAVRREKRLVGF